MKVKRIAWLEEFPRGDPACSVFLDEIRAGTAMDRTHGRCAGGKPVDAPVPRGHWMITTLTVVVRLDA